MQYFYTTPISIDASTTIAFAIPFTNGSGTPSDSTTAVEALGFAATLVSISANISNNTLDEILDLLLLQDGAEIAQGTTSGGAEILQLNITDSVLIQDAKLHYRLISNAGAGSITISSIRMETT